MKLYEIPASLRVIEAKIAEAEGELTPELEAELTALEGEFERKVQYIALLAREAKAEADAVDIEAKRLAARVKSAQRREKGLKDYLLACMASAGIPRIEGELVKVRIQANTRPSIEWVGDEDAIPEGFRRVSVSVDGTAAYDAWKAAPDEAKDDALPEGFRVELGTHLRVW